MDIPDASQLPVDAFIRYLSDHGIIEEPACRASYEKIGRIDLRMGRIALLEGFISPEEINKILGVQREVMDKKFGEVAVDLGIMAPDEVHRLLELQHDELFAFCQCLILDGHIAPATLFAILKGFLERNLEDSIEQRRRRQHERVTRSIRETLKKITVVASMPATVAKLMEMLNDPDVNLDEVSKVISFDVGLTAMLLRLANSAFYGLKTQVTTIPKAVTVLGTKKLKQLVLSASMMENFKGMPREQFSRFWENSMRGGQWAKELSQFAGKAETDEYFLAGFLHNIGELVIQHYFPADSKTIEEIVQSGRPQVETEFHVMGCDHADVGSYLLSLWQLPPPTVQASMLHHHPRLQLQQMTGITSEAKIVNMSVAIVESQNEEAAGQGMNLGQVVQDYRSILATDYRKVTEMRDRVEKTVAELMKWFSV